MHDTPVHTAEDRPPRWDVMGGPRGRRQRPASPAPARTCTCGLSAEHRLPGVPAPPGHKRGAFQVVRPLHVGDRTVRTVTWDGGGPCEPGGLAARAPGAAARHLRQTPRRSAQPRQREGCPGLLSGPRSRARVGQLPETSANLKSTEGTSSSSFPVSRTEQRRGRGSRRR